MHAGGVLIAPGKLTDFCPLYARDGSDAAVSQFDKDDVEAIGLVKFDFLGLTTLTILDWTLRYIAQRLDPASTLTLDELPLDDKPTYRVFKRRTRPRCSSSNRAACATCSSAPSPTASRT